MSLFSVFCNEKKRLEQLIMQKEMAIANAPQGTLRVSSSQGKVRYFWKSNGNENGAFIKANEMWLAASLAQKEYDSAVLPVLKKKLNAVEKSLDLIDSQAEEKLYDYLAPARKALVTPTIPTEDMLVERFLSVKYTGLPFKEDEAFIMTDRGDRVRSKSEKIIADKLFRMGIPYQYEFPVQLADGKFVYADFRVLNKKTGRIYLWEHLGMMSDQNYCDNAIRKIERYEETGIFPGGGLILTYETATLPLNTMAIDLTINRYLV